MDFLLLFLAVTLITSAVVLTLYAIFKILTGPHIRRLVRQAVMANLLTVVRQDLPLATALELAATGETGAARRTLTRIARFLAQGLPLSAAIKTGYPNCPAIAQSLIAAGERAGQLPAAIQQAHRYLLDRDEQSRRLDPTIGPYALVVLSFMCFVLTLVMVMIIPKFQEIFADFDTALPKITCAIIDISGFFVNGPFMPLFLPLLVIGVICSAYWVIRPRRTPTPYLTTRIADAVRWYVPGFRKMNRGLSLAAMLGMIRSALRSGLGLAAAARLASEIDVNWYGRQRMEAFSRLIAQGMDVLHAAHQAELGTVVANALAGGQRCGNFDAALRFAADYHNNLVSRWWLVFRNLAWPIGTLLLGTVIGTIVVGLFLPLIALIQTMAG